MRRLLNEAIGDTVKLKKDQYWSNGDPITANDLLYTAFSNPDLAEIATDRIDDYTVRYSLPNKYSPFLTLLTGVSSFRNKREMA